MTDVLRLFAEKETKRVKEDGQRRPVLYKYSERDYEDPVLFIQKISEYFRKVGITDDLGKIETE